MPDNKATTDCIATLSNVGLIELLQLSVEGENEKIDDIHSLVISSRHQFSDAGHESGPIFAMIDRVLESAAERSFIDQLIAEALSRMASLDLLAAARANAGGGRA